MVFDKLFYEDYQVAIRAGYNSAHSSFTWAHLIIASPISFAASAWKLTSVMRLPSFIVRRNKCMPLSYSMSFSAAFLEKASSHCAIGVGV